MAYHDYLLRISTRFRALFDEISANYNFDLGDEFEIATCRALDQMLPRRFCVCRGFVVTADDQVVGDDIIIYDRNFPTLRFLTHGDFSKKEEIPIEAVYAYIEAKHTLRLRSAGGDKSNVIKAISQVAAVKGLPRAEVTVGELDPYFPMPFVAPRRQGWPDSVNRIYGAVFARRVDVSYTEYSDAFGAAIKDAPAVVTKDVFPDLIVAGEDLVMLPYLPRPNGRPVMFPFLQHDNALGLFRVPGFAFAIGLCSLMYALDTMRLGRLQWQPLIDDALSERPVQG